jgi:hypothetical protein
MDPNRLPTLVNRGSLVLAPLLVFASVLAMPTAASAAADQIAAIGVHPGRWYAFTVLSLVSSVLFVPALLALLERTRDRAPLASLVGTGLAALGAFVAVADSGTQFVYWQMGTGDRAQMLALAHRYEHAAAANAIFQVGGLAFAAGAILLGLALARTHAAPLWSAACFPLGIAVNIVGYAASNRPLLIASGILLIASLARIAATPDTPAAAAATPVAGTAL